MIEFVSNGKNNNVFLLYSIYVFIYNFMFVLPQDFETCSTCVGHVELYNKVSHQKYLMYIECAKRVAEKRSSDHRKDTTMILNELLADEAWLDQVIILPEKLISLHGFW